MAFTLPDLPYSFDDLEPFIDAKTMTIHHDKHHATYVAGLNTAIEGLPDFAGKSLEELLRGINDIPADKRQPVINHGGGHANHMLFWEIMGKGCGGEPSGDLGAAIDSTFGSFASFKETLGNAAKTRFGSGWAWLTVDGSGKLAVSSTPNQDSPLMTGLTPILGLDVWEHAYYLNYQNRRPDYIEAWWNVVNWTKVAENFAAAK